MTLQTFFNQSPTLPTLTPALASALHASPTERSVNTQQPRAAVYGLANSALTQQQVTSATTSPKRLFTSLSDSDSFTESPQTSPLVSPAHKTGSSLFAPHSTQPASSPTHSSLCRPTASTQAHPLPSTHVTPLVTELPQRFVCPPLSPHVFAPLLDKFWPQPVPKLWKKFPYHLHLYKAVRKTSLPNFLEQRWPVPSGLKIQQWSSLLKNYHDTQLLDFLSYGWPIDYTASFPPTPTYTNHAKDTESISQIFKFVATELSHKALLGPFDAPPFQPWTQISPIMTRPKKGTTDMRIVVDMSFPLGKSVNSGLTKGFYLGSPSKFTLPSISDLANLVVQAGPNSYIWSIDLARAYRQLRTCPLASPLLGIKVADKYYLDCSPPFGCRASAQACSRTTTAVLWMFKQQGFHAMCYLDDFVGVAASLEEATCAYQALLDLLSSLGLNVSPHKCIPPVKIITWLGFQIDTIKMIVEIPKQKLSDTLAECKQWAPNIPVSRRQLQRLIGRLKHVSKCLPQANKFFARILAALRASPFKGKHLLNPDIFDDIDWFLRFSETSNGICLLPPPILTNWEIECDSTLLAGGAYSKDKFYMERYTPQFKASTSNIAQLEELNLVQAVVSLLPDHPENYKITINTDNLASQQVLSSGSGRDKMLSACARQLWLLAALYSTELHIFHKSGKELVFADALSRAPTDPSYYSKALNYANEKGVKQIRVTHAISLLDKL